MMNIKKLFSQAEAIREAVMKNLYDEFQGTEEFEELKELVRKNHLRNYGLTRFLNGDFAENMSLFTYCMLYTFLNKNQFGDKLEDSHDKKELVDKMSREEMVRMFGTEKPLEDRTLLVLIRFIVGNEQWSDEFDMSLINDKSTIVNFLYGKLTEEVNKKLNKTESSDESENAVDQLASFFKSFTPVKYKENKDGELYIDFASEKRDIASDMLNGYPKKYLEQKESSLYNDNSKTVQEEEDYTDIADAFNVLCKLYSDILCQKKN